MKCTTVSLHYMRASKVGFTQLHSEASSYIYFCNNTKCFMMNEEDAMQVDTIANSMNAPNIDDVISSLIQLLDDSLRSYVQSQIMRALGPDMLALFMPKSSGSVSELLDFIDQKWISIFTDSSISALRHSVQRLHILIKFTERNRKTGNVLVSSLSTAKEMAREIETILMAISSVHAARANSLRQFISPNTSESMIHDAGHFLPQFLSRSTHAKSSKNEAIFTWTDISQLIVLDGSNIAWRHGNSKHFSMRGVLLALEYFQSNSFGVVMFLPEARLHPQCRSIDSASFDQIDKLRGSKNLVLVPSSDYDDAYICSYARRNAAIIVSNDAFRDVIYQASATGHNAASSWEEWLAGSRLSFTFRQDEFIPNPSFNWEKARSLVVKLRSGGLGT